MTEVPSDLTNATVISVQALHSLALREDGTVVAWGYNPNGEANVPAGLSNVVAIAAGYKHNLAVTAEGTVTAWGDNTYGQCDVPSSLSNVWDVAAGVGNSLALFKDGTVVAWGDNTYGETNVPIGLSNVVAIAAAGDPYNSNRHSLALLKDGSVVAWGSGQVVAELAGLNHVIAIGCGADHALAVRSGPPTPVITLTPTDQYQLEGGNVTFTSVGQGLYGVTYQWQFENVDIPGATNASLTLTSVQAQDEGDYRVLVSNETGSTTSPEAHFSVVTPPVIISQSQPTNMTLVYHQTNVTLEVQATARGQYDGFPLGYQWQFNAAVISNADAAAYEFLADSPGTYSVIASNAAGSTIAAWEVTISYEGTYIEPGTLAYYLSTNTADYADGHTGSSTDMKVVSDWTYADYFPTNLHSLTNAVWSANCWLRGVKGLSATCIGFLNGRGGQGLVTMVSPRHCLFASHMHKNEGYFEAAFLDTNNVIFWRTNLETVHLGNDTSVGILNQDLPDSVGFLPVVPTDLLYYLPTNSVDYVQGIGMNQDMWVFGQPMNFGFPGAVIWNSANSVPFGLGTNWNVVIRGGDSSNPERLLISDQLVLLSHNFGFGGGPNYASQLGAINQQMHYLSTNNSVESDYQLTPMSLTNWPSIH